MSTYMNIRIFGPTLQKATMRGKKFMKKELSYFVGVLFTKHNKIVHCLDQLYKKAKTVTKVNVKTCHISFFPCLATALVFV